MIRLDFRKYLYNNRRICQIPIIIVPCCGLTADDGNIRIGQKLVGFYDDPKIGSRKTSQTACTRSFSAQQD